MVIALTASSGQRIVTVWRPSVRLSRLFLNLIGCAAHTQRDSPGAACYSTCLHFGLKIRRTDTLFSAACFCRTWSRCRSYVTDGSLSVVMVMGAMSRGRPVMPPDPRKSQRLRTVSVRVVH